MKHHFPIPYARDSDEFHISSVNAWLARWGWSITGVVEEHDWLHSPRPKYVLTIDGHYAGVPAKLQVFSGAVLVYDTEERSLGITDRQPREPEDEIPARWREPEDVVPAGFVDRNADAGLIRDRSFDGTWWLPWPLGPKRGER